MDAYFDKMASTFVEQPAAVDNVCASIHYHNITHDDMVNGEGLRVVLWVSGCSHHCEGCHNPQTWNPDSGIPFTLWDEAEFWEWLKKPWTQGATFSGGDPLHMVNRQKIGEMIHAMKAKYPDKDIWLYTGYRLTDEFLFESENDDSFSFQQLKDIDVLVDGRFDCRIRAEDLSQKRKVLWRGSSNQRVIDVRASLSVGRVVEKEV